MTDGQTDRILLAIPRLHYMQRGKNGVVIKISSMQMCGLLAEEELQCLTEEQQANSKSYRLRNNTHKSKVIVSETDKSSFNNHS